MQCPARRHLDERGETLVEMLVAVAILGIAGVAILSGLMLSVRTSDQHRKEATSGAYVRSWAEAIQTDIDAANALKTCPAYVTIFGNLKTENPDLVPLTPSCISTAVTDGIQKVKLTVTSASAVGHQKAVESLTVFLRRPCNATGATPCG